MNLKELLKIKKKTEKQAEKRLLKEGKANSKVLKNILKENKSSLKTDIKEIQNLKNQMEKIKKYQ